MSCRHCCQTHTIDKNGATLKQGFQCSTRTSKLQQAHKTAEHQLLKIYLDSAFFALVTFCEDVIFPFVPLALTFFGCSSSPDELLSELLSVGELFFRARPLDLLGLTTSILSSSESDELSLLDELLLWRLLLGASFAGNFFFATVSPSLEDSLDDDDEDDVLTGAFVFLDAAAGFFFFESTPFLNFFCFLSVSYSDSELLLEEL